MSDERVLKDRINQLALEDYPIHDWYRFVLSYPPHLVVNYLQKFGIDSRHQVLDPFCGTGTTIVECKKLDIPSVGVEANPMAHFASQVKVDWSPDPDALYEHASRVAKAALDEFAANGIEDTPIINASPNGQMHLRTLPPEKMDLLLTNSISPLPLHKTLILLEHLKAQLDAKYHRHELLALAKAVVGSISNLHFGPEVGVGPAKPDASVVASWLSRVDKMAVDLRAVKEHINTPAVVHLADSRQILGVLKPNSIDAVITSPPYPNEKDYTRTTRLESVLLGLINDEADLKALKRGLVRSNTRNVYKEDDDDAWVVDNAEIQKLAEAIEARRIELGKTSGFERLYARVTKLYFGGMARHLADLRVLLRPGAQLAYVVGDQASYLRIMIRTGQLLADIAQQLGYEVTSIDLFRTRLATATKEQIREEVVVLKWAGNRFVVTKIYDSKSEVKKTMAESNRYTQIIEKIFFTHYKEGATEVVFDREDIVRAAEDLGIKLPKNIGDVVYSFRYRTLLPDSVRAKAPAGKQWIIQPAGRSQYRFVLTDETLARILPNPLKGEIKVPDSTPGVIAKYAKSDEQALLAKLRYNRLIDIFTGVACYSLQNHLRTHVPDLGQVETDEIYIGVDRQGVHYVFPVQAKGGNDQLSIVQIEQDFAMCADKFPGLVCRAIAAQFIGDDSIALFAFVQGPDRIELSAEKHYRLVPQEEVDQSDLDYYRTQQEE
jgi:DNA modification methylase